MGKENHMLMKTKKPWEYGVLSVSANKRYLTNGDRPFFWLGDTAWSIFDSLDEDQMFVYLKNRADKGFTVIKCTLVSFFAFLPGIRRRQKTGLSLEGGDILTAISAEYEPYWKYVDKVLKTAEDLGLYLAMLPVWGAVVRDGYLNLGNLDQYADFLIRRYGASPNIIWILGGDIRGDANFEVWDAFGKLLKKGCPDKLIGYHPFGRTSSSYWFNQCEWLDINIFQSGHRRYDQKNLFSWDEAAKNEPWHGEDNWRYVEHDLSLEPCRPVLDGEPSYEQIPQGLHDASEPRWQDHDVRRYGYWSLMAGACGHTYGHNAVFQFFGAKFSPPGCAVAETWDIAIHHPGASQMKIMKEIMVDIGWYSCAPLDVIIDKGLKYGYIPAFGNEKYILAYDYTGRFFTVAAENFKRADAYWIDPVSGVRSYFGCFDLSEGMNFFPPRKATGQNDWLLLMENRDA